MHYKKRKLHKLHSIPIGLCNKANHNRLYLVSYSIPLACAGILLLGLSIMINPDANSKSYAVEVGEGSVIDDSLTSNEFVQSGEVLADSTSNSDSDNTDEGIMTLANVNPSLGLSVTNSDKVIETVQGGNTAYSDHLVTITGTEVTNYTLSMSSSSSNLTKPSGTSGANITGAGGVSGNEMPANRWGYNVTEEGTSNSSYGGLTYSTVPTNSTAIATGNATSSNTLNVKKKIVIAAKFGEDAAPGTYRQTINLSAVANATTVTFKITYNSNGGGTAPSASTQNSMENSVSFILPGQGSMSKSGYKFVGWSTNQNATSGSAAGSTYTVTRTQPQVTLYAVWQATGAQWSNGVYSGVENMQDITSSFCSSSIPAGSTITLKDNRGTSPISYKIIKMGDGTCWMAENLRLMNTTINSTNSDMTSGSFTIPASSLSNFGSSMSTTDGYAPHAYYNNDAVYGAYYNWYTATAGAGTSSVTSGDVSTSICPKGWKLPAYDGTGSFYNIINGTNGYKSSWTTVNGKSGYKFGHSSNDAFWPAAGAVYSGYLDNAGSSGFYWSRRVDDASYAYSLGLLRSNVNPQDNRYRYRSFSVRCVAAQY